MKRECKLVSIVYPKHAFSKRAIRVYSMDSFTSLNNIPPIVNLFDGEDNITEMGKIFRIVYHDINSLRYGVFV